MPTPGPGRRAVLAPGHCDSLAVLSGPGRAGTGPGRAGFSASPRGPETAGPGTVGPATGGDRHASYL
jgi:hypothetical protein